MKQSAEAICGLSCDKALFVGTSDEERISVLDRDSAGAGADSRGGVPALYEAAGTDDPVAELC